MSFFEVPERKPKRPRRRRRRRREDDSWTAPVDYLPGRLQNDFVLASNDDVAVVVANVCCYPTGFGLDLRTVGRWEPDPDAEDALHDNVYGGLLRFGVAFSDGSKATTLESAGWGERRSRPGPQLHLGGGGGGGADWSTEIWITPLPPTGPVGFVCEWPALAIPETRRTVDGLRIRRAADRARPLFPD